MMQAQANAAWNGLAMGMAAQAQVQANAAWNPHQYGSFPGVNDPSVGSKQGLARAKTLGVVPSAQAQAAKAASTMSDASKDGSGSGSGSGSSKSKKDTPREIQTSDAVLGLKIGLKASDELLTTPANC
jgi:hypothetical protein